MRRLAGLLAVALWPLGAGAEEVRIRSGEHAGFSRLVLEFGARPDWSLTLGDRQARLLLAPGERSFDTGEVFRRIPRTRIRSVTVTDEGLDLTLGCDCRVTAFEVRGAALAIDVADGGGDAPGIRNVTPTAATETLSPETAPPAVEAAAPLPIRAPDTVEAQVPRAAGDPPPPRPLLAALPEAPAPDPEPGTEPGSAAAQGQVLSDLTTAIARATTQGNLRLAGAPPGVPAAPAEALLADPAAGNLRLRLPGEEAWLPETPPAGLDCLDPAAFDVASWVPDDRTPSEAMAALQSGLATDLDTIGEAQAIALARFYLGIGFGAEARAVLAALAPRHPETALLEDMARIVDGEPVQTDLLAGQAGCPGRAQLWFALATGEEGSARDIVVAVGELPLALRRLLAPRVMARLAAEGDAPAAEAIRGTIERAEGPHGDPFALAAAQIEARNDRDPGLAAIRGLAAGRSPEADEALAALLEVAWDKGERLDGAILARAETRSEDLRGTALGTRLDVGLIHAHLLRDDFGPAAERFERLLAAEAVAPDNLAALARALFLALGARGADEALLIHAAALAGRASDLVREEPAGAAVAARLVDLGLPGLAERYLPPDPAETAARRLAARARLEAGDAEGALALLAGVDPRDAEAAALRDAALRLRARADAADGEAADGDGPGGDGPDEDWAGSNPQPVAGSEAEPLPAAPGSARALVAASEEARRQVDALLAAAPQP